MNGDWRSGKIDGMGELDDNLWAKFFVRGLAKARASRIHSILIPSPHIAITICFAE